MLPKRTAKLLVTGLSLLAVCGLIVGWIFYSPNHRPIDQQVEAIEIVDMAGGRILNVVVEADGAYIGKEFIPFLLFEKYLKEHRREFRASYVIVVGTENAKFGSAVQVYDQVRGILKTPSTIETRVLRVGTRRPAIEVRENTLRY